MPLPGPLLEAAACTRATSAWGDTVSASSQATWRPASSASTAISRARRVSPLPGRPRSTDSAGGRAFWPHTSYRWAEGLPVWRLLARGGVRELPLYRLPGADPTPAEELVWTIYEMRIPFLDPDTVSYGHFSSRLWSAYSSSTVVVRLPSP